MDVQKYLTEKFLKWRPPGPEMTARSEGDIALSWRRLGRFQFLSEYFLYTVEQKKKVPPWIVVYHGGKTHKTIMNLEPRHPHKFRLKVIIRAEGVPLIGDKALQHYGDEAALLREFGEQRDDNLHTEHKDNMKWLESEWSEETWTSTDTDGTSAVCFCMAVHCGYLKQVQVMLDERPQLINVVNPKSGLTPLATAVRKGDINTVRFLLNAGADVNQTCLCGQTPTHLATLDSKLNILELLLERGADFEARDVNGLRIEHYAVDSGSLETVHYVLDKGGDVHTRDNNQWTPLLRAVMQGCSSEVIEELLQRGSDVNAVDSSKLTVATLARLLKSRHGRPRDSVLRLVDAQYPHDKAVANFTRLTKKISSVHSLLK